MPNYRVVLIYENVDTDLTWSLSNTVQAVNPDAAFGVANTWNNSFMACAGTNVKPSGCMVSDVAVYRDMVLYDVSDFSAVVGTGTGVAVADSLAPLLKGYGSPVTQGQTSIFIHGMCEGLRQKDDFKKTDASAVNLLAASGVYFQQYREQVSPTIGLPIVDPPVAWARIKWSDTFHVRRLGRPLDRNGQTRVYHRHKAP